MNGRLFFNCPTSTINNRRQVRELDPCARVAIDVPLTAVISKAIRRAGG